MIGFTPRKLVNGAILRTSSGGSVAIFLNVENAERYAKTITGKTTDDLDVRADLDEPLNVTVNGWVQVIGVAKGPNVVQAKEIILFPEEGDQQPFDKKGANDAVTFYNHCTNLMAYEK